MNSAQTAAQSGPGVQGADMLQRLPFGYLAYLGTVASVLFCYTNVLIGLILPLLGVTPFEVNPHLQAVLMWATASLAVVGVGRDRKQHGDSGPLVLGLVGLGIIVGTLYGYYDVLILILGYLFLVAAALLNPTKLLTHLNRSVQFQASELAALNDVLEDRVKNQVEEIERLARLRRFLSSEVADLVTREGHDALLKSHRRMIACLFCDVRNFTAFSEAVEPEEVIDVLQNVHRTLGQLVAEHGGTIGYRAGDGLMVIFNDPLPCDDPVLKAARLALDMKAAVAGVRERWQKLGHELGFGIGIAYGYATMGMIGSEGRYDYTAIGNVVNLAARLCDRAKDGEIVVDKRAFVELENRAQVEPIGFLDLKGMPKQVEAFKIAGLDQGS